MKRLNIKKDKIQNKIKQISHLIEKINIQFLYQELPEQQYKDNREKLTKSFDKLELVAKKIKLDIKEIEMPGNLLEAEVLKKEIQNMVKNNKLNPDMAKKWQQKIRINELKEKENKIEQKERKIVQEKKDEEKKILWLLELLEERFIKGEISEPLFLELRQKYNDKLKISRIKKSDFFVKM